MSQEAAALLGGDDAALTPPPLLLLCWKHHAAVIRERIALAGKAGPQALPALKSRLLVIGGSQMDLYTGALAPAAIAAEVNTWLRQRDLLAPELYGAWLRAHQDYRTLALSDGSRWVLRWGDMPGRYIHLHPARYAPHTVRARAAPLKSAIAALVWTTVYGGSPYDPQVVNAARQALLGLSPLPRLAADGGIEKLIALLAKSNSAAG